MIHCADCRTCWCRVAMQGYVPLPIWAATQWLSSLGPGHACPANGQDGMRRSSWCSSLSTSSCRVYCRCSCCSTVNSCVSLPTMLLRCLTDCHNKLCSIWSMLLCFVTGCSCCTLQKLPVKLCIALCSARPPRVLLLPWAVHVTV